MAAGYLSIQKEPTRDESCLDHVLIKGTFTQVKMSIIDIQITDHVVVGIDVELANQKYRGNESGIMEEEVEILNSHKYKENVRKTNWKWAQNLNRDNNGVQNNY